ncbi:MAG: UDP-N-acetylmuramate--L-alanine ligase [Sphingobacteriales bacterium]|nr:UDP-N-acetylmuramate--L-alanine ligase [Sphingobacteriales bacterium]MBK6889724.1 UDP-N-acetylmuramate--L-alanine ligase [Sphingobacteriales bacterium]MBK7527761.1 UDP-N-acetylmuramate--L-alanine ligase [Sphingobacteriales bacterium]MBK8678745.1 UDP-N-acetylmuramate--L-alanine ligase [Sphingobacteriales bacterium]MBL0246513.1 UDP-N-acetylmuramate--L-alanine ligase [Sphingobacteriales bacterium]
MFKLQSKRSIYFIGIGGIGMSAIARYFVQKGMAVAGYDRSPSPITNELMQEGIDIHFEENIDLIPKDADMVVYTPAIPETNAELTYYRENGYDVKKRSEVLAWITQSTFTIAVAGTHGKSSVSAMITHILKNSGFDCTAFVGAVMKNYNSNFVMGSNDVVVVEADEYDKSFLRLKPDIAVITATDADHLDIYENEQAVQRAYVDFGQCTKDYGKLIIKKGLPVIAELESRQLNTYHYADPGAAYFAQNVVIEHGKNTFEAYTPEGIIEHCQLAVDGIHNIENALAAIAVAQHLGISRQAIAEALANFSGLARRFEYWNTESKPIIIDDYAHHPEEIKAFLTSVRQLYPNKKITAIFQPHLYTRTRDFAQGFAQSLDLADEIILLDIYAARENPIEGVTEDLIFNACTNPNKVKIEKSKLIKYLQKHNDYEILLTIGAGDIGEMLPDIVAAVTHNNDKD